MRLNSFKLERYFARYEFTARHLLSSSDCDGLPQNEVLGLADDAARQLWDDLKLGYTESLGLPLLRQEVAGLYERIRPDDALIVAPEEGVFIALNVLLEPGDHVICTFPGYQSLYEVALGLGCQVTKWQPIEEQGWRFDPDFLERSIQSNTRLLVVNFPHNPTGYLPPKEDFQAILAIAARHGLYVLSDEMYRLLELDPADRLPSACEVYDQAVCLFGMSKTFGLAGVRIGWLVTTDPGLYRELAAFKDYTTICSSAPSEILALMALRARESIVAKHLDRIRRNLAVLDAFFQEYRGLFSWVRPRAGTICFPRIEAARGASDFCETLVREAGVMLLPSTVYDYDDRHVRVGFGRESLPEALAAVRRFLGHHP